MLRGQGMTDLQASARRQSEAEAGIWSQAPPEVLEQIMQSLPAKDCWNCRQLCSTWASAARRTAVFDVSIPATPQNAWPKLQALNKHRKAVGYPTLKFRLTLSDPIEIANCASLLEELQVQMFKGACIQDVFLHVSLAVKCLEEETLQLAAQIAQSCQNLSSHDIHVCLDIHRRSYTAPSAAVLELLAPFLHAWEDHVMTGGYMVDLDESLLRLRPSLSSAHGAALLMATSLQSLCICLPTPELLPPHLSPANSMIAAIATLHNLRRLHLTCQDSRQAADLEPLAQLSYLEDVALQFCSVSSSCHHVLCSSKHTLRSVQLKFPILREATYLALQSLPYLQTAMLKIDHMSTSDAKRINTMRAAKSSHIWLSSGIHVGLIALQELSRGQHITCLTLCNVNDKQIQSLQSIKGLQTLRIDCGLLRGEGMPFQPGLKSLTLVDCPFITEVGVQSMVQAFPNVQKVAFMAALSPLTTQALRLSKKALLAMTFWRHARLIDLRGVSYVSRSSMVAMQASFLSQQYGSRANLPKVYISNQATGAHLPILRFADHKFEPSLHLLPNASRQGRKAWSKALATHQDGCLYPVFHVSPALFSGLFLARQFLQAGLSLCQ